MLGIETVNGPYFLGIETVYGPYFPCQHPRATAHHHRHPQATAHDHRHNISQQQ